MKNVFNNYSPLIKTNIFTQSCEKNVELASTITLGLAIEAERKHRKLTQTQLAERSNASINFISQIERGKPTAQIGKILEVLRILGLQLTIEKGSRGVVNDNQ